MGYKMPNLESTSPPKPKYRNGVPMVFPKNGKYFTNNSWWQELQIIRWVGGSVQKSHEKSNGFGTRTFYECSFQSHKAQTSTWDGGPPHYTHSSTAYLKLWKAVLNHAKKNNLVALQEHEFANPTCLIPCPANVLPYENKMTGWE